MPYGKFPTIEAFLQSYATEQKQVTAHQLGTLSRDAQLKSLQQAQNRDIVEVTATVKQHMPDEKSGQVIHYQLLITLNTIKHTDPDIQKDIDRCLHSHESVFVAIRYGDKEGISQPIHSGIDTGNKLDIKGEWIPKDKAYNHGGEKMSVLHFTHRPVGFICTAQKCYQ